MIVIAGQAHIKAELRDEAVGILIVVCEATQQEAGCISYTFSADLKDETLFHLFEEWETEEALASHLSKDPEKPHMAEFRKHLPRLLASGMLIKKYEIASVSTL